MPNLESIIITNCIGIAVVILTLVSSVETRRSKTPDTRLLTVMLLMIALSCFMEALSYIVDGKPWSSAQALGMLSNTWLYLSTPTFAAIWCLYVDYHLYHSRTRLYSVYRPLIILTVVLLINAVQQIAKMIQIALAKRFIPSNHTLFVFAKHASNYSDLFIIIHNSPS